MKTFSFRRWFHWLFEIGMILKGIDGVLETIGGLLLLVVSKAQLNGIIVLLTQYELSEDPHDRIANAIVAFILHLPVKAKLFGAIYLLIHGIVKLFLVYELLRERLWAFPVGIAILSVFAAYTVYDLNRHFSFGLLFFAIFNVVIIGFVWYEWRMRKEKVAKRRSGSTGV